MTHAARTFGSIHVTSIVDADFPAGPIAETFPGVPADALFADDADASGVRTDDGQWRIIVRAWLIRHADGVLLFDTGLGGPASPTQDWASTTGALVDELSALAIDPGDVDTLALSHVHDDHIGGLLDDDGAPVFQNARYVVQRADIDWLRALAPDSDEDRALLGLITPLHEAGVLDEVEGDHRLAEGIELHALPGHTPGHQILRVVAGAERLIISADTWNHPAQLAHPEWPSGPDDDPEGAAEARRQLRRELADHPGTIVAPTHLAEPFVTIADGGAGPIWRPA